MVGIFLHVDSLGTTRGALLKDSSKLDSLKNPSVKSISSSSYNITNGLPDDHVHKQDRTFFVLFFIAGRKEKKQL